MNTVLTFNLEQLNCTHTLVQRFYQRVLEQDLHELSSFFINSRARMNEVIKAIPTVPSRKCYTHLPADLHERNERQFYLFDLGDMLIYLALTGEFYYDITGAGEDRAKLDKVMEALQKALPPMRSTNPKIVPVNFWAVLPDGNASSRTRQIAVPLWKDVRLNYTLKARKDITSLLKLHPPLEDAGRLMLWHGVAGTGKSYSIRTLAQAWREWCNIHYIVDPERFFGDANYMLQVILQNMDGADEKAPPTEGGKTYKGPRWNLLIMEDSDEFLAIDAKRREGQSMARLLNLTSGFIGQGLNILVLITTNEPIDKIHKALQREGRCMANIEFGKLGPTEVREWVKAHGIPPGRIVDNGSRTVAELYNLVREHAQIRPPEKPLGLINRT